MKPQLLADPESRDLAETFEHLAGAVRAGAVVGVVMGVVVRGRQYHVHIGGTMTRDPTFARGVCRAIDDDLMVMVQGRAHAATTL